MPLIGQTCPFIKIIVAMLLMAQPCRMVAQPKLIWAKQTGGKSNTSAPTDKGTGIVLDEKGNSYTTGNFWDYSDFDPGPGSYPLTTGGVSDVFVCKLNANGQFVWARRMGGQNYQDGNDIAIDKKGFLYLTGNFQGVTDFAPGKPEFTLTPSGYTNGFVCKMDTNGNVIWAKQLGGVPGSMDQIKGMGVAVDDSGNVYSVGLFGYNPGGGVDLDPGPGTFYLTGSGDFDLYISKLDKDGNFVWGKKLGTPSRESINKIALDQHGDIFITGYFKNKMDFDPGPGEYFLQSGIFDNDIFICKLNKDGNLIWAKRIGGANTDIGNDIYIDSRGNVLTTGEFAGAVDFDPGDSVYTITGYSKSAFVSKLNNGGDFLWARSFNGGYSGGYSISTDRFNNIYFTGDLSVTANSPCDMDPGPGTYLVSRAYNSPDIFICKLDSSGNFITGGTMGGPNGIVTNKGLGIAADQNENMLVTGTYTGQTPDFDPNPDPFAVYYMKTNNMDDEDIFICKYGTPQTKIPIYPRADFLANQTEICQGICIGFTDKSAYASEWSWKFPGANPAISSERNPSSICYPDTGTYAVQLSVLNSDGKDSLLKTALIKVLPQKNAGMITAENDSLCEGSLLKLSLKGQIGNIQWQSASDGFSYSDLNQSDSLLVVDPFEQSTYFRVITTEKNCPDTSSAIKINSLPNPDAGFTISGGNLSKSFEPNIADAPGMKYLWNFGDNSTSAERNPTHLYRLPGDYTVCLTITSAEGCTGSSCENLSVGANVGLDQIEDHTSYGSLIQWNRKEKTLSFQHPSSSQSLCIYITDIYGRLLSSEKISPGNTLDLKQLSGGIYFIQIKAEGYTSTIRFSNFF